MKRYYSLYEEKDEVNIYIYGDIVLKRHNESNITYNSLSQEIENINGEKNINVYINSYGGDVAEGLAIYNALNRYKGKVTTIVDGFCCSIASVIFLAGDERIMPKTSLLMIHNAWTIVSGDANELKKQAENLEKVTEASINAYMKCVNIDEYKLKEMLDNETWLNAKEAKNLGFATKVIEEDKSNIVNQSIKDNIIKKILNEEKNIISEVLYNKKYLEENKPKSMLTFLLNKIC